jgi:hypothetical protein
MRGSHGIQPSVKPFQVIGTRTHCARATTTPEGLGGKCGSVNPWEVMGVIRERQGDDEDGGDFFLARFCDVSRATSFGEIGKRLRENWGVGGFRPREEKSARESHHRFS